MSDPATGPTLSPAIVQAAVQAYERVAAGEPGFAPHTGLAFEQLATLGEGGMGVVLRVRDRRLDRQVAVKLIRGAPDARRGRRFRREAQLTASLEHPSIPPVYEAGITSEGLPYLAMRLIEGRALSERIREHHDDSRVRGPGDRRRERQRLLEALVKVGEAVAYAHGEGVVHRDLKPDNVMVGRFGEVMVMDWGLAKRIGDEETVATRVEAPDPNALTQEGAVMGTIGYVSPEQAAGKTDRRADVFALGAMLTEVLTGELPTSTTAFGFAELADGRIRTPSSFGGNVPRELDSIAARALAADPNERTQTAEEVVASLRAWLAGEDVPEHDYGPLERLLRGIRRRPAMAVGLLGVLLLFGIVSLAGIALLESRRQRLEVEAQQARAEQERALAVAREAEAEATRARIEGAMQLLADAEALFHRGQRDQALGLVERSLGDAPGRLLLWHAARVCQAGGELARAKALLERIIAAHPPALEELYRLHRIEAEEQGKVVGSKTPAMARLRAAAKGEESAFFHLEEAAAAEAAGRMEAAVEHATRALELNPTLGQAANLRAAALHRLGRVEEAIADFRLAVALEPEHSVAWSNLGWSLSLVGKHVQGLRALDRSMSIRPTLPAAKNRGNVYQALGRYEEAIRDYNLFLDNKPGDASVLGNRGNAHLQAGRLELALADYEASLRSDPRYLPARSGRCFALARIGRHEQAFAECDAVLRDAPRHAAVWGLRGACLLVLGRDPEDALDCLERALDLAPNHADAPRWRERREQALERLGR